MDYYEKIAGAKATNGGNYLRDGEYLLGVEAIKLEKGHKGVRFVAEFRVLDSSNKVVPDLDRNEKEKGVELIANTVGSKASFVVLLDSNDSAAGNAKAFLLALDGTDSAAVEANPARFVDMMKQACSPAQPLRGAVIRASSFRKTIRVPKDPRNPIFMGMNWQHVTQTIEEIVARRNSWDAEAKAGGKGSDEVPF